METHADKLKLAQDRLIKVLADTHCDFVTINRLAEAIERAASIGKCEPGARHVQLIVVPGNSAVSWTVDSTKIRERIAGRYSA